jgi:hypothetical protein
MEERHQRSMTHSSSSWSVFPPTLRVLMTGTELPYETDNSVLVPEPPGRQPRQRSYDALPSLGVLRAAEIAQSSIFSQTAGQGRTVHTRLAVITGTEDPPARHG